MVKHFFKYFRNEKYFVGEDLKHLLGEIFAELNIRRVKNLVHNYSTFIYAQLAYILCILESYRFSGHTGFPDD